MILHILIFKKRIHLLLDQYFIKTPHTPCTGNGSPNTKRIQDTQKMKNPGEGGEDLCPVGKLSFLFYNPRVTKDFP